MNKNLLKSSFDRLIYARKYHQQKQGYQLLVDRMKKTIPIDHSMFPQKLVDEYREKWSPIASRFSLDFFKLYSSNNGIVDTNYVPDHLYDFPMKHILLNTRYSINHDDKNSYENRLRDFKSLFPEVLFRKICGVFYTPDYDYTSNISKLLNEINEESIVVKDSVDSAGGKGVCFFTRNQDSGAFINSEGIDIITWMSGRKDIVAQSVAKQSSFFDELNSSSINTFRIVTYRSVTDEKVSVTQSLLRVGSQGSRVDNWHSGGLIIGIQANGSFCDHGFNEQFEKVAFPLGGMKVPLLEKIHNIAIDISKTQLYHRQISYDFYIDETDNVRIMEINYSVSPVIQLITGPAFGKYTNEVIDYCANNKGYLLTVFPVSTR